MNAKRTSGDGIIQVQIRKDIPTQLLPGELVMYQSSPTTGILYKGNPDGSVSPDDTSTDIRLASGNETHLYLKWDTDTGKYEALTLAELKTALAYTTSDVGLHAYRSVSENATLNKDTDVYLEVDATSGNKTVNVPSAITNAGKMFVVKKVDSSSNYVAVTPFVANQKIDGIEYHYLRVQYASIMIYSDGANWKVIAKTPVIMEGTPINAVASSKVLTVAALPEDNETVTIGGVVYTAKTTLTEPAVVNEILKEDTAEKFIDNLVLAITGGAGEGVKYGTGTVAHTTVTAAKTTAATMTATALTKGVAGDLIALAESLSNGASVWAGGATFLSGGVNGTLGLKGDMYYDTNYIYFLHTNNTIADNYWRRIALGSAF